MKTHRVTTVIILFSLCISVLPLPHPAWAHRVNIFAWVEGDTVYVETKFPGGKKVKAGHIVVVDVQGNELLSGVTNDGGEFSFKIPKREDLTIVLLAGEGHRAEWTLLASEMEEWPEKMGSSELTSSTGQQKTTMGPFHPPWEGKISPSNPRYDVRDLEEAIEPLLDRKLKPIMKMLVEAQQKGPRTRDIIAGIGYILGLVGIAAYIHSRKRKE